MSHGHKGHHSGSEWELLYRHEYHGKEFIIRIDSPEKFEQWKKGKFMTLPYSSKYLNITYNRSLYCIARIYQCTRSLYFGK